MNRILALAVLMACSSAVVAQKRTAARPAATVQPTATADTIDIKKLTAAATAGNAAAQNTLGICYYTGRKVAQNYDAALRWWSMAAKQKHAEAVGNMALCYQYGNGARQDSVMAMKLYRESVRLGNTALVRNREAALAKKANVFDMCLLADIYASGTGAVRKDSGKALGYYLKASDCGSVPASFAAAQMLDLDRKYPEALKRYAMAADYNAVAAYKYGEYLCKGLGTSVDKPKAAQYLKKAAAQDVANAQLMLGDLYFNGDGVERNVPEAVNQYKKAASHGNPAAMWNVGVIYLNGSGVKADYNLGLPWLAIAAQKGMARNVQERLDKSAAGGQNGWKATPVASYMHGLALLYGPKKDVDAALKCFTSLEKLKNPHAAAMIAACYLDTQWSKANAKKAVKYLEKAVADADLAGYYLLSLCCEQGNGVAADKARAVELLQKSADGGYVPALCRMGDLYNSGWMVSKNVTLAIKCYLQAMANGYLTEHAAEVLAYCYRNGIGGLERDEAMAKAVADKAQKTDPVAALCGSLKY